MNLDDLPQSTQNSIRFGIRVFALILAGITGAFIHWVINLK